jgi:CD63 antigen
MVQGGMKCIKYILFFFNLVFVALGIVLLAVGISTKTGFSKHLKFIDPEVLSYPPNLFIAAGAIIFIIAFLGCYGSWKESHCMMITYSVLLGLLLVLELGAAFSAFALEDDVERIFVTGMEKSQNEYNETGYDDITKSWNAMQHEWHCCGTKNYTDWGVNKNLTVIPDSCCLDGEADCTTAKNITAKTPWAEAEKSIYVQGCWTHAVKEVTLETIGIVGIVLAVIELLGIISACMMARSIRYSYETV